VDLKVNKQEKLHQNSDLFRSYSTLIEYIRNSIGHDYFFSKGDAVDALYAKKQASAEACYDPSRDISSFSDS
jgi:hypothetical protein